MVDAIQHRTLEWWIERQTAASARRMAASISAVGLVKHRPGFGRSVRPVAGSVIASPVMADYDPEPDYFFHWLRDSALVMSAVVLLAERGDRSAEWRRHLHDFVHFSHGLSRLNGAALVADGAFRRDASPDFLKFVRSDTDLAAVTGDRVAGEVRVNPDGTLDTIRWSRPQHDGPALRALTLMRAEASGFTCGELPALLRDDLDYTMTHAGEPCVDLWEDVTGRSYYTLVVQYGALLRGAARATMDGDVRNAARWRDGASSILSWLDACWSDSAGHYLSHVAADPAVGEPDIAIILGVLHADLEGGPHSIEDERVAATLAKLEAVFRAEYPINADLPAEYGPALGRFPGDTYYSGGAYYFASLAAAEFHYRRAAAGRAGQIAASADAALVAGDALLATVRRFTPADGAMAEQFDRNTGTQTSARDLAWSHAALITAVAARSRALTMRLADEGGGTREP